jgi:diguanylate cyclase (GGDEF)-like protein
MAYERGGWGSVRRVKWEASGRSGGGGVVIQKGDRVADERDRVAADRDRSAERRDRAAQARDRAAEARDRAADERSVAGGRFAVRDRGQAASDRAEAARDRDEASRDRGRAARDRGQAARDRAEAGVDALTGALRRDRGLVDLQREITRARRSDGRLVLAFVDVDGLKAINDSEGHAAGDRLLRDVATTLRNGLRSYDLVIRYGGDEFVCALPDTDVGGARQRFEEVARSLAEKNPGASVSVGLAALENEDTVDRLTSRADAALYSRRRAAGGLPTRGERG